MITLNITPGSSNTGSGIDVTSVVDQILNAERASERLWQSQQATLTQRTLALTSINTSLAGLKDKVNSLKDVFGALTAKTVTSSQPDVLSATVDASAAPGNHTVTVSRLASTSSYYTDPLPTGSTTLGTGTVTVRVGSQQPVDIVVDATNNTPDLLAAYINSHDLGITAGVINDATGARLALVSKTTGDPGDLTISGNISGLTFQKSVTGVNASVTIDGVPVSSTSNTISTALTGVTLNLASAAPGTEIQLAVAQDTTRAKQAVQEFVASYNTVMAAINSQFAVDPATNMAGPLAADGSLRALQASLLSNVTYSIAGNNGMTSLASIGVNMANDGSLSVDDARLTDVVNNHFADFQNFFQTLGTGYAQHFSSDLMGLTNSVNGPISLHLTEIKNTQALLTRQISDFEDRLAEREKQLILQYSRVDTMLRQFPLLMAQITGQLDMLSQK